MDARSVRKRDEILGKQFKTNKCGDCVVIDYTTNRSDKGKYPTGVCLHKKSGKFLSYLNRFGVHIHLGYFLTSEDASKAYVQEKEIYVKDVAEKWKGRIDDKVYKHLSTWSMGVDFSGF